jgi:protein-disulfide isomerase
MEKKTKKELKELRRMEREARNKSTHDTHTPSSNSESMKWITLGVVAVIIVGLLGFIIYNSMQRRAQQAQLANQRVEISDLGWAKGATEAAKVTFVEFADFQCPACKAHEPMIDQVVTEYGDQVKIVYKHFPLSGHQNAMPAARAAEAAGVQGKFWEMHDLIFARQDAWSAQGAGEITDTFISYAQELELDIAKFQTDFDSDETEDRIKTMQNEGINLGVMATPTFFVNGKRVESGDYSFMKQAIEAELQ